MTDPDYIILVAKFEELQELRDQLQELHRPTDGIEIEIRRIIRRIRKKQGH